MKVISRLGQAEPRVEAEWLAQLRQPQLEHRWRSDTRGGETAPQARPEAIFAVSGRGLRIVRSYAHEWGVTEKQGAVTVWAALGGPSRRRA